MANITVPDTEPPMLFTAACLQQTRMSTEFVPLLAGVHAIETRDWLVVGFSLLCACGLQDKHVLFDCQFVISL